VVAASSLVLPSVGLVAGVVAATSTVVPIRLTGAGTETTSWWQGWRIPCLLEGPVSYLVVGLALLIALPVFLSHPLSPHPTSMARLTKLRSDGYSHPVTI
jgi:multisubunit Na+/H+ antiporter MnhB subunit